MITKAKLKEQLERLPEEFTIDELVKSLVFFEKIESGLNDSNNRNKIKEQELEKLVNKWI